MSGCEQMLSEQWVIVHDFNVQFVTSVLGHASIEFIACPANDNSSIIQPTKKTNQIKVQNNRNMKILKTIISNCLLFKIAHLTTALRMFVILQQQLFLFTCFNHQKFQNSWNSHKFHQQSTNGIYICRSWPSNYK